MKKVNRILSLLAVGVWFASFPLSSVAQDYDDDLYYSPKAAEKKKAEQAAKKAAEARAALRSEWTTVDYPASDSYSAQSTQPLNVDVDAYNRRTTGSQTTAGTAPAQTEDFSYTRRIERYHNPEVVAESGDDELIEYYYATSEASQPEINVYVINDLNPWYSWNYNPWRYGWNSPYWNWNWSWNWGWNDPWFNFSYGWGPSWNWGPAWAWGPSWGWGAWGPSWGPAWGWHPGHGPGHGPGHAPAGGWATNSPGVSRPHGPSYGNGTISANRRPGNLGHAAASVRPSAGQSSSAWDRERPGNMGRPTATVTNKRPGANGNVAAPSNGTRPSNTASRGVRNGNGSSNNNNSSNYRQQSTPSRSTSSFGNGGGGGSFRSSGGGGGSRSTGGGGGGGRGRR